MYERQTLQHKIYIGIQSLSPTLGISHQHTIHTLQQSKYKKAYEEVVAARSSIPRGTRFTIKYEPHDGKGEKEIECLNLEFKTTKVNQTQMNAAQKKLDNGVALDPPVTPFIPTTHGGAALKTPRTKATAAEIGARAPKDEDDRWEKWVFEDVALEDGEFFAGKILRLETNDDDDKILVFVPIKKTVGKKERSVFLDDFMENLEAGVFEWLGNDGAAAREASERYKAWLVQ